MGSEVEKVEKQDLVYSIMRKENFNPNDLISLATPGSEDGWCMSIKWKDDKGRIFVKTTGEGPKYEDKSLASLPPLGNEVKRP